MAARADQTRQNRALNGKTWKVFLSGCDFATGSLNSCHFHSDMAATCDRSIYRNQLHSKRSETHRADIPFVIALRHDRAKKKPTRQNTLRYSIASAYLLTSPSALTLSL